MKKTSFLLLSSLVLLHPLFADVVPNPLFTDNAVLQQGMKVPVWGTAGIGEKITVEFAGQKVSTIATNGTWMLFLEPLTATTNSPNNDRIRVEHGHPDESSYRRGMDL